MRFTRLDHHKSSDVDAGVAEVHIQRRLTFQNHCITGWLGQ